MATKKKRTSLDALISPADTGATRRSSSASPARKSKEPKAEKKAVEPVAEAPTSKSEVVKSTIYLPLPVSDQLRDLLFEEQRGQVTRRRLHDYYLEGIDLLFKDRGLKSIEDLTGKK